MRQRYRRKPDQAVTAIRLTLNFDGFSYQKWGGIQRAQPGDWLVEHEGDVHTVAADSFARTYRPVGPGRWIKTTPVWAEVAAHASSVATKEGHTHFQAGDWLVSNAEDGSDAYAVSAAKFKQLYEADPGDASPETSPMTSDSLHLTSATRGQTAISTCRGRLETTGCKESITRHRQRRRW